MAIAEVGIASVAKLESFSFAMDKEGGNRHFLRVAPFVGKGRRHLIKASSIISR